MDIYNVSLIIAVCIVLAVIILRTVYGQNAFQTPLIQNEDIVLPRCFSASAKGIILINGKALVSSKNKCYIGNLNRVYANHNGHIFVELIENNYEISMIEFDQYGQCVAKHQNFDDKGFPVKTHYTDNKGRLHVIISINKDDC